MKLKVITQTKVLYEAEVEKLILPTTTGLIEILKGHENLVTTLEVGEIVAISDTSKKSIASLSGLASIKNNEIKILLSDGILAEEIIKEEVDIAIKKAEHLLNEGMDPSELIQLEKQTRYEKLKQQLTGNLG